MSQAVPSPFVPGGTQVREFRNPERIQRSILSSFEKRSLIWIAERLPQSIHSDHLTILGFVGMILAGLTYALSTWIPFAPMLATFFLAVNWFGDSLDGTLARVRNRQRPRYGFYVDHAADTIGILFLLGGLAISGSMSPCVAAGFLIAYYILCIEIYLSTIIFSKFKLSFGLFGPTELRILLAIGNLALLFHPGVSLFGREFHAFDVGGVLAIAILVVLALTSMIRSIVQLYHLEPLPKE